MLLTCLLVGLLLIVTIFAIALVWDYTHGISPFGNNTHVAIVELPMNDGDRHVSPQPVASNTSVGEKSLEQRTDSSTWQKEEGRRTTSTAQESIAA